MLWYNFKGAILHVPENLLRKSCFVPPLRGWGEYSQLSPSSWIQSGTPKHF